MSAYWHWMVMGGLIGLALVQEVRVFLIRRASRKREELFQIVTENAADMIALVDVKGNRIYNSPAYKRILGYSAAELGETSAFDQIHPDDRFNVLEAARQARDTGAGRKLEYRIRHKNGSWLVFESLAGTIRDQNGQVAKLVIVNRDVTERKRAEELAEHNALHDSLTGLPNRKLFTDRLHRLFERAKRTPARQYALLFVNLDSFKGFNSVLGAAAGDRIIAQIGERLRGCLRAEDTVSHQDALALKSAVLARMGGDEFSVLLEGVGEPSDAMRAAKRILAALAKPIELEGREARVTASIGIALIAASHEKPEDLLQEADVAMRRAKALGGSRCELFDEAMQTRAVNRLKLESELRTAVTEQQFRIYYQPIVEMVTQGICGFEALLRWQHPTEGLISPARFLEAAEDTGLLVSAGQFVLLEACRQVLFWDAAEPSREPVQLSVNVSTRQLYDPNFVTDLQAILCDTKIDPRRLRIEVNEVAACANEKLAHEILSQLHQLKVRVVLDNFGAGNSSLNGLRQLPVDAIKIDRTLVTPMLADRRTCETVDLIIAMARKLKIEAMAEGVETSKHWEWLRDLGCELGQGYFFSPPLDAEAAGKLLQQRPAGSQAKGAGAQ